MVNKDEYKGCLIYLNTVYLLQDKRRKDSIDGRPLELFLCSVLERQGCAEAFRWLASYLN